MNVTDPPPVRPERVAWRPGTVPAALTASPTLGAALVDWCRRRPDDPAVHLYTNAGQYVDLTVAELAGLAAGAAADLVSAGVRSGSAVAISLDTGPPLVTMLFGAFLLGAVPVVMEPPLAEGRIRVWRQRVGAALSRIRPAALVTAGPLLAHAEPVAAAAGVPVVLPTGRRSTVDDAPRDPDATAYLQLTSGTVADARAAVFSHRALYANADAIGRRVPYRADDVMVSWLPLHHDMGLAGAVLSTFLHRIPVVLLPPMAFLMSPTRWLWAVHQFRATLSPAPNFAYQLCATKAAGTVLSGLDLTSWRAAFNGAEVVSDRTLRLWSDTLSPYGFAATAMRPSYGMAEVGVAVTMPGDGQPPTIHHVDAGALATTGDARPVPADHPDSRAIVGVGRALPGYQVRVLDTDGRPVGPRRQGRVQVAGPSLTSGYLGDPESTAKALVDGWLDTGDLGYLDGPELFVTGRHRDMLIVAGRNVHPYPVEAAVAAIDGVRSGSAAVVGVPDPRRGTEAVVVVVESPLRPGRAGYDAMIAEVSRTATAHLGVSPAAVEVVRPGALPRTSSGKLQRGLIAARHAAVVAQASQPGAQPPSRVDTTGAPQPSVGGTAS